MSNKPFLLTVGDFFLFKSPDIFHDVQSFLCSREFQEMHVTECQYSSSKVVLCFSQKAINQLGQQLEYEEPWSAPLALIMFLNCIDW